MGGRRGLRARGGAAHPQPWHAHPRGGPAPCLRRRRRGRRTASDAGAPSGLGLGLYITRQIVRAHDGDAQVASSATEGTTFLIRLPR
ncbi:ATP-binding protein [Myxococcus sp. MxC21-1]|uniref:ATP-binding protein n=1 Tax=Myxococcus sp. MxC21-1 TaxID=3041439 RepID=UPI003977CFF7